MIIDRYEPDNVFAQAPDAQMDPFLAALDPLLDDDAVFTQARHALAQRRPFSLTRGRPSTPVDVILRMLALRRLNDWSYEDTEVLVRDGLSLRQFCHVYWHQVPDDTTLIRAAKWIGAETLERLNERVVALAKQLKVTKGRLLRQDGMVVETTIHHPSDSSLLTDGVRVLSRLLLQAKAVLGDEAATLGTAFRNRTQTAKRVARAIGETARKRGAEAEASRTQLYTRLLAVTRATVGQAERVQAVLGSRTDAAATRLRTTLAEMVDGTQQVIEQTERRVLQGETVPAAEKIVSLFERHTTIIRRDKMGKDTEFGRKVWIGEADGGILTSVRLLDGNPPDAKQCIPTLERHVELFGHPPWMATGDRGLDDGKNEQTATQLGVTRVVIPVKGHRTVARTQQERQRWFRRGRRFQAGIEGRISVLKRRGHLGRCRDHGEDGFVRWIGWGQVVANLRTIGQVLRQREQDRTPAERRAA